MVSIRWKGNSNTGGFHPSGKSIPQTSFPVIVAFCFGLAFSLTATAQNAFVESNGLVVIEAESVELFGDWVQESADAGYTGDGYIRWNGPNYLSDPGHGILAYTVVVGAAGEYNVRLRMSHLGAPAGDQWNDCWVKMNDGAWVKAVHPSTRIDEGFTFHSPLEPSSGVFDDMRYSLKAGENTLYISGRSTNLRLDRIHFYTDSVVDPLNPALPESERTESSGGGGGGGGSDETPASVSISGEQKKWHPITLTLDGPEASETGTPNPFLDYRFEVTFSQGSHRYTVPGFFAADGNSAETSATSGNKWRVHFVPDRTGPWNYVISMRSGTDVAVNDDPNAGAPTAQDGLSGSFNVSDTDKVGADHRAKGMLRYVGEHYLRFDNGDYFLKGGADSPENFLAYEDFDGTFNHEGVDFVKDYSPHLNDWESDDPTWKQGKGKGIVGALNYLASKGMNVVYFITMNVGGDGNDVWPWTSPTERIRFDVSKLAQWNIVFDHMDRVGIMLHVVTQETENELLLNNGSLGRARKLYYRELVARFGYHHAVTWNLGEENENTDSQRKDFASYIRSLDPYDHPIVIHTFPSKYDEVYDPLLGFGEFEGPSIQIKDVQNSHSETMKWRQRSGDNGRPWVVTIDEQGPYQIGVSEDGPNNNHYLIRRHVLWGNLMAGGGGVEYYFGYDTASHDLNTENWRTRDSMWNYTRYALEFFHSYLPFADMAPMDGLTAKTNDYVFAQPGRSYAVYTPDGGSISLDLASGDYSVRWFNPRSGGGLQAGAVGSVSGPGVKSIGAPPSDTQSDWVALVRSTTDNVNKPSILVSPTTLNFQAVMPGASKMLPTTITNNGGANLNVSNVEIAGDGAALYSLISNPAPFTLTPGASKVIEVSFAPGATDTGTKNATLRISNNDPGSALMNVSLTGSIETSNNNNNGGGDGGGGDGGGGDGGGGDGGGGDGDGGGQGGRTRSISVIGFTLVNSATGEEIRPLKNGDLVDLSKLPQQLNIWAETDPPQIGSVQFSLNKNSNFQIENSSPYSLAGDVGTQYNSWAPKAGEHKLVARPFSSHNGTGAQGIALEISFTVSLDGSIPSLIDLDQNYPNPFANSTTITFTNHKAGDAKLVIYDLMGRHIATLVDRVMPSGTFKVVFEASNLRSGTYFYRYENNGYVETKKMLIVR